MITQNLEVQKCDDCQCIISKAREIGAHIQLIGGWAIFYRTPQNHYSFLQRKYADIDIVGKGKEKKKIYQTLQSCGYQPDDSFNGLYGDMRLLFWKGSQQLDVFLDKFEMCHSIDLSQSLNFSNETIGLGELLFTKLQIFEINEKDMKDIVRLLLYADIDEKDQRGYSAKNFIVKLCAEDWGIYKTLTSNLIKVGNFAKTLELSSEDSKLVQEKILGLLDDIEHSDKSLKWKMRSRIGEKVRWYELPEEKKR
ncbi:MAG: hypothetical protein QW292_10555 [Candidatus Parvarchaeota archaeon]